MAERQPLTEVVQTRMTEDQLQKLWNVGAKNKAKRSDLTNMDGSVNLSATVRFLIDTAKV